MASSLRPRISIDYKVLNEGEFLIERKVRASCKVPVLEETYYVDRLIWRRKQKHSNVSEYLVQWNGFHISDSTWEPSTNLPAHVISNYTPSSVSDARLAEFSSSFERVVTSRLKTQNPKSLFHVDFDLFRFVFGTETSLICHATDFTKLNLPDHWYYQINKDGAGRKIKFPVKLNIRLTERKTYVKVGDQIVLKLTPVERCTMLSCTESCTIGDI